MTGDEDNAFERFKADDLYNVKVTKASMRTDEIKEAQTQERFSIDFTDMPGIGIKKSYVNSTISAL